jgi:hypothetical protein
MLSYYPKFIRIFRLLSSLIFGISFLVPSESLGEELPASQVPQTAPLTPQPPQPDLPVPQPDLPVPQPAPQTPTSDRFDSMESSRDYLSAKITSFASQIDRFFGGDRHYQESNESVVQVDLTRVAGYGGDRKFDLEARLNLRLPITEGRLHLLVETDPEKNITAEPTTSSSVRRSNAAVSKSLALAARYATAKEKVWHFSTDVGIKFPLPPRPFIRSRGSYNVPLGEWRLKAEESVYWFNTLGAGETTQLDIEKILSAPFLFRATSNATWLHEKQNLDMRQDLSVFHTLSDRSALLYQASVIGVSNPQFQVADYVVLLFYRYRLHQEWLFFEISPQMHFPKELNHKLSPALSMRLEVLFDDSR